MLPGRGMSCSFQRATRDTLTDQPTSEQSLTEEEPVVTGMSVPVGYQLEAQALPCQGDGQEAEVGPREGAPARGLLGGQRGSVRCW